MPSSPFSFISDAVLRSNIEEVFEHIARLLEIVDNPHYSSEAKSAFCKSIIIHTGSVIEALLYTLLDYRYSDDEIKEYYASWQLKPFHQLHMLNSKHQVVAGQYKLVPSRTGKTKLNLSQVCDFLKVKEDIDDDFHKKVTKVRNLRNEQHLATQKKLKTYTHKEVEEVFKIAREIKEFVRNELQ